MLKQILKFKEAILYSVIIFGGFVWLLMQIIPQVTDLIKTEQKIKSRTVEYEKVSAKLEKIKEENRSNQIDEEERVKQIYKPDINFDNGDTAYLLMVDDIVGMVKDSNIKIYSVDYNFNPQTDNIVSQSGGKYLGCQMTLSLIGSYNQIRDLLIDFIKYPYLITINSVEAEPYQKDKNMLLSVLKLTIYTEQ
ncbi:hypothetical protein IJ732_06815 [bacterium]|nr:hypothetical protein [bacterium]